VTGDHSDEEDRDRWFVTNTFSANRRKDTVIPDTVPESFVTERIDVEEAPRTVRSTSTSNAGVGSQPTATRRLRWITARPAANSRSSAQDQGRLRP
jgi:hypothetical protein